MPVADNHVDLAYLIKPEAEGFNRVCANANESDFARRQ
jgi:hypothetical protein